MMRHPKLNEAVSMEAGIHLGRFVAGFSYTSPPSNKVNGDAH